MLRVFVLRSENDSKALYGFLKSNWVSFAQNGKPLSVTVAQYKASRNDEQNRKYWAMLADIAESAWVAGKQYSKEQWHMEFASEFIGWDELPSGKYVPLSTTKLTVAEFSDYLEKIIHYAAEKLQVELS